MMSYERFEKAADFLDLARAASEKQEEEVATGVPKTMLKEILLDEFDEEMLATRRLLERVPKDRLAWKPHEKAFTLGKLANHVAAIPGICGRDIHPKRFQALRSRDRIRVACLIRQECGRLPRTTRAHER